MDASKVLEHLKDPHDSVTEELEAIQTTLRILVRLEAPTRQRILRYLVDRFANDP